MDYRTAKPPTLRGVIGQIGAQGNGSKRSAIVDNGRGLRLVVKRGGDGNKDYHVRTRPRDRGREWNIFARISQELALVKHFEKEIDAVLGKGQGEKLTKEVGAYRGRIFPKLTTQQLENLRTLVAKEKKFLPPPGFDEREPVNGARNWRGAYPFDPAHKKALLDDLRDAFQAGMDRAQQTESLDEQFTRDLHRTSVIVNGKELIDKTPESAYDQLLAASEGSDVVARNLSVLLVQTVTNSVNNVIAGRHSIAVVGDGNSGSTTCRLAREADHYLIEYFHDKGAKILVDGRDKVQVESQLDPKPSDVFIHVMLKISLQDLKNTDAGGLEIVGTPTMQVNAVFAPPDGEDA